MTLDRDPHGFHEFLSNFRNGPIAVRMLSRTAFAARRFIPGTTVSRRWVRNETVESWELTVPRCEPWDGKRIAQPFPLDGGHFSPKNVQK